MTPWWERAEEFIDLCAKLRALGATKVSCGEFSAEFVPVSGVARVADPFPTSHPKRPEREPTIEEANEARRRRELGL